MFRATHLPVFREHKTKLEDFWWLWNEHWHRFELQLHWFELHFDVILSSLVFPHSFLPSSNDGFLRLMLVIKLVSNPCQQTWRVFLLCSSHFSCSTQSFLSAAPLCIPSVFGLHLWYPQSQVRGTLFSHNTQTTTFITKLAFLTEVATLPSQHALCPARAVANATPKSPSTVPKNP